MKKFLICLFVEFCGGIVKGNVTNAMRLHRLHFHNVEDNQARELLTDLLFARISVAPRYLDYNMNIIEEAEAMASELGSEEGLRGKAMKSVTLDRVVEKVLSGSLKLTRQTQLEKK